MAALRRAAGWCAQLWVKAGSPPGSEARWNVFDATGRWLDEVRVPATHALIAPGDGYVIGARDRRWMLVRLAR